MLSSISAKFSVSLITVILLGVVVGGLGVFNSKRIMDANAKNEFTHEVIENLLGVRENLMNIETGERGFLLRGDDSYLAPYNEGKERVQKHLDKVTELTASNPVIVEELRLFNAHYRTWLNSVVDPLIDSKRLVVEGHMAPEDFSALVDSTPGKPLMDKMREALAKVEAEEYRLLKLRQAASQDVYNQSIWITIAITVFALMVGLTLNFSSRACSNTSCPQPRCTSMLWPMVA